MTPPLTDAEVEEIEKDYNASDVVRGSTWSWREHVRRLLAEVKRLRADRDEALNESDHYRCEYVRLRIALQEMSCYGECGRVMDKHGVQLHEDPDCPMGIAIRALKAQP